MKFLGVAVALVAVLWVFPSEAKKSEATEEFEWRAMTEHNVFRRKHGVPPLSLDAALTRVAQRWANHLARLDSLQLAHSGNREFGENMYMTWMEPDKGETAVDYWYREEKQYMDYNNDPTISGQPELNDIGHFTQIVWKDTKKLGIARAQSKSGKNYVVANYSPPGNSKGQFVANVLPPRD